MQQRPPTPNAPVRPALKRGSFVFAVLAVLAFGVAPLFAAEPTALLGAVSGTVAIVQASGTAIQPAGAGTSLGAGDRVSTVGRSSATIDLPGLGQIELGADTTLIIHRHRTEDTSSVLAFEIVRGMTVHRLAPSTSTPLDYRVIAPGGLAVARATGSAEFGVGRDENGNVTVACARCSNGVLTFPGDGDRLSANQARTLTGRGAIVDDGFRGSIYDALAEGAAAEEDSSDTPAGNRLPPGQRTGSRDERRSDDNDDDSSNTATVTAPPTVSPTATVSPIPTQGPTLVDQEATIANFVYLPDPIQIRVGQTVRWTNLDDVEGGHTVTASDRSWSSPVLNQGDTYVRTFTQPGSFMYFCEPHPQMTAFIEVQP